MKIGDLGSSEGEQTEGQDGLKLVTLKNGSEVTEPQVIATMASLNNLIMKNPSAFHELVMKCRDHEHKLLGNTGEVLSDLRLIQPDGRVHESIQDIVLSATEGEGIEMTLGLPVAAAV